MKTQAVKGKKKASINNRIIGRMLIALILITGGFVAGYAFIAWQDVVSRAELSLQQYLVDEDYYFNDRSGSLFYTYEYYVGDGDFLYMDFSEEALAGYYRNHKEQLPFGHTYRFMTWEYYMLFMPVENAVWEDDIWGAAEDADAVLVYCEMSYEMSVIRSNVLLLSAVIAALLLLLFLVSRYTVKTLDAKDTGMKNFFANASHELKTPLMSIRGNVDGIRSGYVETRAGCEVIEKEVDRMSALISDILEISRLDSGAVKAEMLDNDVREILYDAASSVLPEIRRRGLTLEMELPDPIFRKCDEAMLYSAFSNILTNDIRFAESRIRVSAAGDASSGPVTISFENDGTPISREDSAHIFDRFYKGRKGQSGIGMALAQEYVKLHGSEIRVDVKNGCTVFEMAL